MCRCKVAAKTQRLYFAQPEDNKIMKLQLLLSPRLADDITTTAGEKRMAEAAQAFMPECVMRNGSCTSHFTQKPPSLL